MLIFYKYTVIFFQSLLFLNSIVSINSSPLDSPNSPSNNFDWESLLNLPQSDQIQYSSSETSSKSPRTFHGNPQTSSMEEKKERVRFGQLKSEPKTIKISSIHSYQKPTEEEIQKAKEERNKRDRERRRENKKIGKLTWTQNLRFKVKNKIANSKEKFQFEQRKIRDREYQKDKYRKEVKKGS